jgi:NAD(P)-dependent dehydrogenase (short-subunit alcohol dehydrogenase family)
LFIFLNQKYKKMNDDRWTTAQMPDLKGKVIIVTGGNSGTGYESVKAFAMKGAEVVLAGRSMERCQQASAEILKAVPDGKIDVMQLDLADLDSVKSFAAEFIKKYKKLDVLLNNAGIMMSPYFQTKDGFEGQFGTNHLGHFALTVQLMDVIRKTAGARVVNVSSGAHKRGEMDFDNLQFENGRDYSPMKAYGRSKLANLLFTYELQRRFESVNSKAIAVAAHPGVARTNLGRYMEGKIIYKILYPFFKWISQDQSMGALPLIRASVDPEVKGGEYYGPDGRNEMKGYPILVQSNAASHNTADAARLWEESEKLTGVKSAI